MLTTMAFAMCSNGNLVWKFGIGSNMNVQTLTKNKGITIIEHHPAMCPSHRLGFHRTLGPELFEPSFATIVPIEDDDMCVHGLATLMTTEQARKLDRLEGGDLVYGTKEVQVQLYEGRRVTAEVYVSKRPPARKPCSRRYLKLMIEGAKSAGIRQEYIAHLEAIPHYIPDHETLTMRSNLLARKDLNWITVDELREHNGSAGDSWTWTSSVGFVLALPPGSFIFPFARGSDVTRRRLAFYRGNRLDGMDSHRRPFPMLHLLAEDEREYLMQGLDNDSQREGVQLLGKLEEFWADQILS